MEVLLQIILLLAGFVLLIKGADFFVDGSCAVAAKLRIPTVVVGLTIVAAGTSLPELAVSTFASAKGANALALSNVIGSNIFNLLMVLGISALFIKVPVKSSMLKREFPFLVLITIAVLCLAGDALWFGGILGQFQLFDFRYGEETVGSLSRLDGVLLLLLFAGFIGWTLQYALKERKKNTIEELEETETLSNGKCALYILGGAAAIVAGGELVVDCAKSLALAAGMSETLVGLTIVALGTSLPELVTSAVAAKKGEADIAIGNVVGSSIANILLVLGMSAAISSVSISLMAMIDTMISLVVTVIVFLAAGTRRTIKRSEGIIFLLIYAVYLAYIICRQIYG